jgi:hypothetical protein
MLWQLACWVGGSRERLVSESGAAARQRRRARRRPRRGEQERFVSISS